MQYQMFLGIMPNLKNQTLIHTSGFGKTEMTLLCLSSNESGQIQTDCQDTHLAINQMVVPQILARHLISIGLEWSTEWQLYGINSCKCLYIKGNRDLQNRWDKETCPLDSISRHSRKASECMCECVTCISAEIFPTILLTLIVHQFSAIMPILMLVWHIYGTKFHGKYAFVD